MTTRTNREAVSRSGSRMGGMSRFCAPIFTANHLDLSASKGRAGVDNLSADDCVPLCLARSISDSFASDKVGSKPLPSAPYRNVNGKSVPLTDIIEAEREHLFGNSSHARNTYQRDEMSRFGSRLMRPPTGGTKESDHRRHSLHFARDNEPQSTRHSVTETEKPNGSVACRNAERVRRLPHVDGSKDWDSHNDALFQFSANNELGANKDKKPQYDALPVSERKANNEKRGGSTCSKHDHQEEQISYDVQSINIQMLYNIVADGAASHVILDTRSEDDYDEEHVRGAVVLDEGLTYTGRHFILVGNTSEIAGAERKALEALHKTQRALSTKILAGGYPAFRAVYPFFCEPSASSKDQEFHRMRERRLHVYPSQVLPGLFIGGVECARDEQVARDLKLSHVISILAKPEGVKTPQGCRHLRLPLRDEEDEDISSVFATTQAFLAQSAEAHGRVLIHCKMGRSRSAALVLMWLIKHHRMPLATAWPLLKLARRQIGLNAGFTRALIAYERMETGTATASFKAGEGLRLLE